MSTQGEYFVLVLKLQEQITNTLQETKPAKPHKAINIMNEYEYNSISDKTNLYTFFFEVKQIIKVTDYNYVVSYTLHEHATTAMTNTQSIGMLLSLQRATTITQTKIKEGYLFSTQVLEDVVNIDDPLAKGNIDTTIIKEIELDIDPYTDIDISDIENQK